MSSTDNTTIKTRIAEVSMRFDDIIFLDFADYETVELQDRIDVIKAAEKLAGDKKYPVIVKTGDRIKITQEARKFDMDQAEEKFVTQVALVIKSLSTRVSAHFYFKLRKSGFDVKVFATIEEAESWIKDGDDKNSSAGGTKLMSFF